MDKKIVTEVKGIVCCRGRILVLKRSEFETTGANEWECPGGRIKFGESPENALEREVYEETGLNVKVKKITHASSFIISETENIIVIFYLCTSNHDMVSLSTEHGDYMWVRPERLVESVSEHLRNDVALDYEHIMRFIKCEFN